MFLLLFVTCKGIYKFDACLHVSYRPQKADALSAGPSVQRFLKSNYRKNQRVASESETESAVY